MAIERAGARARVFDFDDTLIGRELVTRSLGLVSGKVRPHKLPTLTREKIAQLDINHDRVDGHVVGWKEVISFRVHARRSVLPGVKDELERLADQGVNIYGNTGRSNKADWVDMTDETLYRGRVRDHFKGIFYTPEGTKTAVSKAHGLHLLLEQYDQVEFDDDDPRTARFIATMFPEVQVNLVQYGSTGLLVARHELETFPNLRRVAVFGTARAT